ncbi:MAG TPA: NADH-quinone oxidoreductase subunit J [Dongiaceae bacterium]|nr:NADH-quinone oxidoreductase subunit J [Dongiaceae bacterium]
MPPSFYILAALTIAATAAALSLRNLVHCALALSVAFIGLAAVYLQLDAQFVGLAQILVYVGAVSILVVFAILLTRNDEATKPLVSRFSVAGAATALVVLGVLTWAIDKSEFTHRKLPPAPAATVRQIGDALMTHYVLALEVIALLLTAALIGAVIIAMHNEEPKS